MTVTPGDLSWVARAVLGWDCSSRWALRGRTPPPPLLDHLLWDGVLAQTTVAAPGGVPAGLVQLVDVDFHNGVGQLGALLDPRYQRELTAPIAEFLASCFRDFPLRKICIVAADDLLDVPAYVGPRAPRVGRFTAHDRRGEDAFADVSIYELWPESRPAA